MPIYEYQCPVCERKEERIELIPSCPTPDLDCVEECQDCFNEGESIQREKPPWCCGAFMRRIISACSFRFKEDEPKIKVGSSDA